MNRGLPIALALTLALAAAGCRGGSDASSTSTGSKRTLTNLHDINQLKSAFDSASGEPRLIVLVSPT
jgi:hypothetical protein